MTEPTLNDRVSVPDTVVSRELDGETVLLNLETGIYFGLDAVATDMWRAMLESASLADAFGHVGARYDVAPDVLRDDLLQLARQLFAKGLLQADGPSSVPHT